MLNNLFSYRKHENTFFQIDMSLDSDNRLLVARGEKDIKAYKGWKSTTLHHKQTVSL